MESSATITLIIMFAIVIALGWFVRRFTVQKSETLTLDIKPDMLKLLDWSEWIFLALALVTGQIGFLFLCLIGAVAEGQLNRIEKEKENSGEIPVDKAE